MSEKRNQDVELPRIKRKLNSWEGKVIEYLLNHPSQKAATEFSMEALTAFWLAEALVGKVSNEELSKACWSAIEKLEGKLATIRRIAGIEKKPINYTTNLATATPIVTETITDENNSTNSAAPDENNDDKDDEDWESDFIALELTPEMKAAEKLFDPQP